MIKKILIGSGIIFFLLQFIPIDRENPPIVATLMVEDDKVQDILKKSCYDCHSNETNWPWYSYVAPVSFWVVHDVEDGRKHLNFSIFEKYPLRRQLRKLEEIIEEVKEEEMPLLSYKFTHPSASLDKKKKKILFEWVKKEMEKRKIETDSL